MVRISRPQTLFRLWVDFGTTLLVALVAFRKPLVRALSLLSMSVSTVIGSTHKSPHVIFFHRIESFLHTYGFV